MFLDFRPERNYSSDRRICHVATSGGAGYCAGDVNPTSGSLNIINSRFISNDAQLGGSIYTTTGCIANVVGSTFSRNTARQYGSAIVTTDYVSLSISGSSFTANGNSTNPSVVPPLGGGAVSIGYNQFVVGALLVPPARGLSWLTQVKKILL